MISIASITDQELIRFFIDAYLIPEEEVTEIRFIDATGNGFGEEDLIKCFPSGKTYYPIPSDTAQKIMNSWEFTSNFQNVTQIKEPEVFENLETDKAANWILAGLLRRLNWNYNDLPMKIYFEQDTSTVVFDMWGYNPNALQWKPPPPPPKVPETTYDILHVYRSDTLYVADTTYYDQFYIYRTVADTLFISQDELQGLLFRKQATYQPGLVPSKDDEN